MMRAPLLALAVAEKLAPLEVPWEVYAERSRRFEIQLSGSRVEMTRGPLRLEGYGIRVLSEVDDQTGVGFQASTDLSERGVRAAAEDARSVAQFNRFPAHRPELPLGVGGPATTPQIVDSALWADPALSLQKAADDLLAACDARRLPPPTFATIKATLVESSLANSHGMAASYTHTAVEREIAVKAEGGPEGRPPGEFWYEDTNRRIRLEGLEEKVAKWYRLAEDARRGVPPSVGEGVVVLPPEVLSGILPSVISFQFGGVAQLRGMGVAPGTVVGSDRLDVRDNGLLDWSIGSSPVDDEGTPQRVRHLISEGKAMETLTDVLHANALKIALTGNACRATTLGWGANYWRKFARRPTPDSSTIVLASGTGGSDSELIEQVEDGVWVEQLGWANPDRVAGTFGGEIRIGYRIRGGKLAEPVRGGTVGGAVLTRDGRPSLLNGIRAMGSVARSSGDFVGPTLVLGNLVISGDQSAATSGPGS
jgi:TldD protein